MMAAAIIATAANRSRTNRTMMIPISAPPKHRSQVNAAICVGSRQLQQRVEYECCKFGRLRRNPPPLGRKRDAAGKALWSICKSRGGDRRRLPFAHGLNPGHVGFVGVFIPAVSGPVDGGDGSAGVGPK